MSYLLELVLPQLLLLTIDEMERKAFLKLNLHKSMIEDRDNIKFITVCFENTTDNLIVDFEGSKKLLLETNWVYYWYHLLPVFA